MQEHRKMISGMLLISVFVLIVALSSLYVQTQISSGNACGCMIPLTLFVPLLASIGLFIGMMVYYMFSPKFLDKKSDVSFLPGIFEGDEKTIVKMLFENKGERSQAKIVRETGISKVRVFRAIEKLRRKGVIKKEPEGRTNKIILTEKIRDML